MKKLYVGMAFFGAAAACSASRGASSSGFGGSGASSSANSSVTATGSGGVHTSTDAITVGVGGSGGDSSYGCSSDLRSIIDANGTIVMTCPPDKGCAAGGCVPACQAAADSHGNFGCDFVMSTPNFYSQIAPPCFAAFLANNWDQSAKVTVSRGGQTYDPTIFGRIAKTGTDPTQWPAIPATGIPPGEVGVLFLSHDPASLNGTPLTCPVPPAIAAANGTAIWTNDGSNGTAKGLAWHVTTSVPVSTYDILPFGGATSYLPSAELVFPTSAWGTNYVAVLPPPSQGPPWGQIIASQDNTKIDVLPSVSLPSGPNVPAASANVKSTFILNAGEYIQWQGPEMIGTIIQSDKPIAFMGGDGYQCYSSMTNSGGGCDSGHQLIPPVGALGDAYVAPPFAPRAGSPESIPYLLVGAADGTQLTYDPPIPGAPSTLQVGQSVQFETAAPFLVKAQDNKHPFYIGQEMAGNNCNGDEDFVNLIPPAQWLSKYVFYTDYSYDTTNLVFVRAKGAKGFEDVVVDCSGGPLKNWVPVGSGKYEMTTFDLVRNGAPNGACQNGPHVATSNAPFTIMVWGLASCASYGYPAGGNAAVINTVIVPPTPK